MCAFVTHIPPCNFSGDTTLPLDCCPADLVSQDAKSSQESGLCFNGPAVMLGGAERGGTLNTQFLGPMWCVWIKVKVLGHKQGAGGCWARIWPEHDSVMAPAVAGCCAVSRGSRGTGLNGDQARWCGKGHATCEALCDAALTTSPAE